MLKREAQRRAQRVHGHDDDDPHDLPLQQRPRVVLQVLVAQEERQHKRDRRKEEGNLQAGVARQRPRRTGQRQRVVAARNIKRTKCASVESMKWVMDELSSADPLNDRGCHIASKRRAMIQKSQRATLRYKGPLLYQHL